MSKEEPTVRGAHFVKELFFAAALFGLWTALRLGAPVPAAGYQQQLTVLMEEQRDLWGACVALGESLNRGEDAVTCLGQWCQTVFLPGERTK